MMLAISASPTTIAEILAMADKIRAGEMQISEAVDGFVSDDEADDYVAEEDFDEFDAADDDDGKGGSKALTKKLEELKREALSRFDTLRDLFEKVRALALGDQDARERREARERRIERCVAGAEPGKTAQVPAADPLGDRPERGDGERRSSGGFGVQLRLQPARQGREHRYHL